LVRSLWLIHLTTAVSLAVVGRDDELTRTQTIFDDRLSARQFDNQAAELFIKCVALSRMTRIAKPDSYKVEG
jgi:hypothetical protein